MTHYRRVGHVPPKRHTQHRHMDHGDGAERLLFEELMGEEGFSSDSSLLYHREIPSAIVDSQAWDVPDLTTTPNHPLKPRHLRLHELFPKETWAETDAVTGRRVLLANNDVRLSYVVSAADSPLYRNATGDEIVYVESGTAAVETIFGTLAVRQGDYVVIPTSTTHRWLPTGDQPLRAYAIGRQATSRRRSGTCRATASSWRTPPTANATCTARTSRSPWTGRTSRSS